MAQCSPWLAQFHFALVLQVEEIQMYACICQSASLTLGVLSAAGSSTVMSSLISRLDSQLTVCLNINSASL